MLFKMYPFDYSLNKKLKVKRRVSLNLKKDQTEMHLFSLVVIRRRAGHIVLLYVLLSVLLEKMYFLTAQEFWIYFSCVDP